MPLFSIATFDERGPIKSWARLTATQVHNSRSEPLPHCDPNGPSPSYLIGSTSLVEDLKTKLRTCGLDPNRLRSNGVIAYEVILSASHEFFASGTDQDQQHRLGRWVGLTFLAARAIWGDDRIVQMALHLDEYTPHIHVVLLPLVLKTYARWPERGAVWALNGREIAGPGEYQRVQSEYAAAMAPLGLERGVQGSNAKHRPYAEEVNDLEAQKARAVEAAAAAATAQQAARDAEAERVRLWMEQFDSLEKRKADIERRDRQIAEQFHAIAADQEAVRLARADLGALRTHAESVAENAEGERLDAALDRAAAEEERLTIARTVRAINGVLVRARELRRALHDAPLDAMPPGAVTILSRLRGLETAIDTKPAPANDDIDVAVLAALRRGARGIA